MILSRPPLLLAAGLAVGLAGCATLAPAPDADHDPGRQGRYAEAPATAPRLSPTGSAVGDAVTGTLTLVLLAYLTLAGLRRH